jgi:hypothetical protein
MHKGYDFDKMTFKQFESEIRNLMWLIENSELKPVYLKWVTKYNYVFSNWTRKHWVVEEIRPPSWRRVMRHFRKKRIA